MFFFVPSRRRGESGSAAGGGWMGGCDRRGKEGAGDPRRGCRVCRVARQSATPGRLRGHGVGTLAGAPAPPRHRLPLTPPPPSMRVRVSPVPDVATHPPPPHPCGRGVVGKTPYPRAGMRGRQTPPPHRSRTAARGAPRPRRAPPAAVAATPPPTPAQRRPTEGGGVGSPVTPALRREGGPLCQCRRVVGGKARWGTGGGGGAASLSPTTPDR